MTFRFSTALAAAAAALALACTTDRAANLRHPVGGTTRLTYAAVAPEDRYAGTPPQTPAATSTATEPVASPQDGCAEQVPAVEFPPGSSALDASQHVALLRVARCLGVASEAAQIVLVGHRDHSGAGASDRSLGAERAAEVRDRLVSYGVSGTRIIVTAPDARGAHAVPSRGVEIFVTKPR